MEAVERYGVDLVTFHLHIDAKLWWRAFVECRLAGSLPLTWTRLYLIFLEKVRFSYFENKMWDELLVLSKIVLVLQPRRSNFTHTLGIHCNYCI